MGCGYEAPLADAKPWDHIGRIPHADELDDDGERTLPVCPGYVCGLPEVIEISRLRQHAKMNTLGSVFRGQLSEPVVYALEQLDGESQRAEMWALDNPQKKSEH
jgi:hypothetical protein